jgi:hypothetical protein
MAQEAQETVNVRTPGGKVIPILKSDLATAIKRGAVPVNTAAEAAKSGDVPRGTQGAGPTLWEAANKPIGKDVNKPLQGINHQMDDWIAKNAPEGTPDAVLKAVVQGANLPFDIMGAVEEAGRRTLSPIGVATLGLASKLQALRESATAPKLLKTAVGAAETGAGAAFGASGIKEAATKKKGEGRLDEFERRLSALGQGIMGLAPVAHAVGPSVKEGAKTGSQELLGIGEKSVDRARTAAESETAEKLQKFGKSKAEREAEVAEQKAEKEKRDTQTLKEHKELQEQEKARARGEYEAAEVKRKAETDAAKKKFAEDTAAAAKERVAQSKTETARRSYEDLRDRHAESTAENLDKAEKTEKLSLDARYEDFRKKILGVSKEFPNGTLEADLSSVGEAVVNARKNILKGSAESIKQFNDILGKLKDFIETPEGDLKPLPGQKITADQLNGYVTELNEKLYDSGAAGDVRDALKHVRDAAVGSVTDSIGKGHGKTAVKAYSELKGDYNDYMDTWRDTASGSPLPAIRKLLRQPMAAKRGIPVYREVAKILEGARGEKAIPVIARKRAFGADPALAAKLRKTGERISALPKTKGVPEVARPEYPAPITKAKINPPKPPEIEPFKARGKDPERPETKPFSAEEFRKEKIGQKAESLSNLSMWDIAAMSAAIEEVFRGKFGTAAAAGSIPVIKRLLARGLSNEGVIDWLSKDKPVPERRSPSSKSGGPAGVERRSASDKAMQREVLRESIANAEKQKAAKGDPGGIIARQIADFREMLAGL